MVYVIQSANFIDHRNLDLDAMADLGPIPLGSLLKKRLKKVRLRIDDRDESLTDFFRSGRYFVVSNKVKEVIESFNVFIELFPLEISNTRTSEKYYFLNVLNVVDCLDVHRSSIDYESESKIIKRINRLVIQEEFIESLPPVFLIKGMGFVICISESLKNKLEELGVCSGVRFVGIQSYTFPPSEWC